jgi:hypothetical protein
MTRHVELQVGRSLKSSTVSDCCNAEGFNEIAARRPQHTHAARRRHVPWSANGLVVCATGCPSLGVG